MTYKELETFLREETGKDITIKKKADDVCSVQVKNKHCCTVADKIFDEQKEDYGVDIAGYWVMYPTVEQTLQKVNTYIKTYGI